MVTEKAYDVSLRIRSRTAVPTVSATASPTNSRAFRHRPFGYAHHRLRDPRLARSNDSARRYRVHRRHHPVHDNLWTEGDLLSLSRCDHSSVTQKRAHSELAFVIFSARAGEPRPYELQTLLEVGSC